MAKSQRTPTDDGPLAGTGSDRPSLAERIEEQIDESAMQKIQTALADAGMSGGTARIYRQGLMDVDYAYIKQIPVEHFDVESVKKAYGGGEYKVVFYKAKNMGGQPFSEVRFGIDPRIQGALDIEVQERRNGQRERAEKPTDPIALIHAARALAPAAPKDSTELIMAMQSESSRMMMTMMMENQKMLMTIMGKPQPNQLEAIMPVLLAMIQQNKGGGQTSLTDLIGAMKHLKELASDEREEEPKSMMDSLGEMLPSILQGIAGMRGQAQLPQAPAREVIVTPPPADLAQPAPASRQGGPADSPIGRQPSQTDIVMMAARRQTDPALYADFVDDNTPDDQVPILISVLTADTWLMQLFGNYPDAAEFRPWLEKWRSILLAVLNDQPPPTDLEQPADGGAALEHAGTGGPEANHVQRPGDAGGIGAGP